MFDFAKGAWYALDLIYDLGYQVVGLDWLQDPAEAVRIRGNRPVVFQGNADPGRERCQGKRGRLCQVVCQVPSERFTCFSSFSSSASSILLLLFIFLVRRALIHKSFEHAENTSWFDGAQPQCSIENKADILQCGGELRVAKWEYEFIFPLFLQIHLHSSRSVKPHFW
jgi:hypothetical protein